MCVWGTGGENEKFKDLLAFGIARLCSTKTKQKMVPSMCVLLLFFHSCLSTLHSFLLTQQLANELHYFSTPRSSLCG